MCSASPFSLLYLSAGVQGIFEIIAAMQLRKEISDPWMLILAALFDSRNPAASALALGHWRIRASLRLDDDLSRFPLAGRRRIGWLEAQPDSRFGRYSWRLDT